MQGGLDGKSVWRGRDEYVEFLQTWTAEFRTGRSESSG
jgi:hypothetical protein